MHKPTINKKEIRNFAQFLCRLGSNKCGKDAPPPIGQTVYNK